MAASPVYNQLCWSKIYNFHLLLSSHTERCPHMYLAKSIVVLCCSSGIQKLRINLGFSETDHPPIPNIRELKQQLRQRLQKREFTPLQTLSRLFHLVYFVKCWQIVGVEF